MSMTDYTRITPYVRQRVKQRDSIDGRACCIYCGSPNVQVAHYVSRSRGGIGKETNLACLCPKCHAILDNGDPEKAREIKEVFRDWLKTNYKNWTEEDQIYRRY